MNKGDRMMIKNKTVATGVNPAGKVFDEGMATLYKPIDTEHKPEIWLVEFDGEFGEYYPRFIYTDD